MLVRRNPWMKRSALLEIELRDDVVLHRGRRRGRERDDRCRTQERQALAQHAVLRTEVVPPLRDAVGFVDRDEGREPAGQQLGEARHLEPLGGDEEEVEPPLEVRATRGARRLASPARVDSLRGQALRAELGDLVLHQGDEGADDQRRSAARDPGQLVAERLAGAGRHHEEHVAAEGRRRGTPLPGRACRTRSRTSRGAGRPAPRAPRTRARERLA